jgi:hypothetical protein
MEQFFKRLFLVIACNKLRINAVIHLGTLLVACQVSFLNFGGQSASAQEVPTSTDPVISNRNGGQLGNETDDLKLRAEFRAALERAAKAREERMQGIPLPPSQFPLPNPPTGPNLPLPICVNFYSVNDSYTNYLLCLYPVSENHYDPSNETNWFEAALLQVRTAGPEKFPPLKWVAIIIANRAEMTNTETIDQSHKVGEIFNARDVFGFEKSVREIIGQGQVDRHPFHLDSSQPTPSEQQRWLIVERHAATNNVAIEGQH